MAVAGSSGPGMCNNMRRYIGLKKKPTLKMASANPLHDQESFASATDASSQDGTAMSLKKIHVRELLKDK